MDNNNNYVKSTIQIKSVDFVCIWSYNCDVLDCGICRKRLSLISGINTNIPKKNIDTKIMNDIIIGKCNHAFHSECFNQKQYETIENKKDMTCEVCGVEWENIQNEESQNDKYFIIK